MTTDHLSSLSGGDGEGLGPKEETGDKGVCSRWYWGTEEFVNGGPKAICGLQICSVCFIRGIDCPH